MSETDATPPDDPGDQSSSVTNALLGYVFNCMHFSSVYNLRAVVLGHLSADAIHKAKETLAQHVASSVVGEVFFTTRRGSSARGKAKARTGKAKEKEEMVLDDIIEAMEAMDKARVSVEFYIAAYELHLLPRTRPEDLLSVTFMDNQMSILKQKVDHLETTAHASGSSCVSPETIPMSSMPFPSLNAINLAGTMSSSMDPTSSAPVYSTRDKPFLEPNHANPPRSYSVALQKNSDGGTAIPWTKGLWLHSSEEHRIPESLSDVSMHFVSGMPDDEIHVAYHDNQFVFEEVLNDVADLIQISNIDRIVFGGDFNTELSRRASTHTRSLNQFVTNESLSFLCALSCYEVDYTQESDAHGTRSTLDHFNVSREFRMEAIV
ncbi:hypothetical protein CAPTEDRAFT_184941 [Capitella teleta]|uniref:Endonuclease/exonuclease/phosphatase domain-containing protein n=1 Tax=Capitella teleta TaxID=283909 RepID=R7U0J1_CAPTE|nr:hypothetical protein CAPTEDRAFT_184941 [Capitella teleta]|eukprot:ELT99723.1 hypothetical protein CAPTEDRAFT_184941 [Capitella teleta]